MSKAFTKESDGDDDEPGLPPLPAGVKNYITPAGFALLKDELLELIEGRFERRHRLARVRVVHLGHGEERIRELLRGRKLLGALSRPGRIFLELRLACMACGNRVRIVRRDE